MGLHLPRLHRERALSIAAIACFLVVGVAACSSTDEAAPDEGATPNPNGKTEGSECTIGFDCRSGLCKESKCAPTAATLNSSPTDGEKNGDETDVDCGGSRAGKCADGKTCEVAGDCTSAICKTNKCVSPSPTDGAKNADETDVDCGGKKAPKCAVDKACVANADCASDACAYNKKCVEYKGCTGHFGGDTCGEGETGVAGAKQESCCKTVDVADGPGGGFKMDKYLVTAGRMRAFVERWNGDLKKWASTNPPGWNQALTPNLPENMDDVNYLLGPGEKRGCNVTSSGLGGRTWSQPAVNGDPTDKSDFSKDVLDEKALNCVTWLMGAAVCASDGGHMTSAAEMAHVYENRGRAGGATTYPWQFNDNSAYNPANADLRVVHRYSYSTPNPPALRKSGQDILDKAFWVAPPGRRPAGANMHGVQDAAGNVMPWVSNSPRNFVWTMSWEKHDKKPLTPANWATNADGPEGYYAIGVRCTR